MDFRSIGTALLWFGIPGGILMFFIALKEHAPDLVKLVGLGLFILVCILAVARLEWRSKNDPTFWNDE